MQHNNECYTTLTINQHDLVKALTYMQLLHIKKKKEKE
jgi:hypothetical protein